MMDDEEIKKFVDNIDINKVDGQYIHFGNFIMDCVEHADEAFKILYVELYQIHEMFLAEWLDTDKFDEVKDLLLETIDFLRKEVGNLTKEGLKETWDELVENAKDNIKEISKTFGKDKNQGYFV